MRKESRGFGLAARKWGFDRSQIPVRAQRENRRAARLESLEDRCLMAGDLVAHWVANDLEPTIADGGRVTDWADRVTAKSVTSTGQPALVHHALSGRAVVRFDGTDGNDALRVIGTQSPMTGANDFSVTVVFRTDSTSLAAGGDQWFNGAGLVAGNRIGLGKDWGLTIDRSGKLAAGMSGGFGLPTQSVSTSVTGYNDGQLHIATLTRSGGTVSIYVDDSPPVTITNADTNARDSIPLTIGGLDESSTVNSGGAFTGDIAEVRIYNGQLSSAEAGSLFTQLHREYFNTAPVAIVDSYTLSEDPAFGIFIVSSADGVLKNDTDAENNPLAAVLVESTQHGTLGLSPDGGFSYAPAKNFFGTDSFTYRANDGQDSNQVTVTLNVTNTYDPAVAIADSYKLLPSQTLNVSVADGLLANDTNLDGATLSASVVSNPTFGTVTLQTNGAFQFNPQGQAGTATFTYRVNDQTQQSAPATVTLVVNTPPVANNDTFPVSEDTPLVRTGVTGVTANDVDADGNAMTVSLVAEPTHGTLTLQADGAFTYAPTADYFGPDSFTYQLSDGIDASGIGVVNLNVQAVNDAPIGVGDSYYRPVGQVFEVDAAGGVLANDADIDSVNLSATVVSLPAHGTLSLQSDGAFVYTPAQDYKGTDQFTYQASDGAAKSTATTVTLLVGESPVRISELMAANATGLQTRVRASNTASFSGTRITPDWVELQNLTNGTVDIGGYHLTDSPNIPDRWTFPVGTTIEPGGFLVVYADKLDLTDPELDETGRMHLNFKLSVGGEYLALTSPNGDIMQQFDVYPEQRADVSYGLTPAGSAGYLLQASPGEVNGAAYNGMVPAPKASVPRGFYEAPFNLALTTTEIGAVIRYTTDGSEPTVDTGTVYTGPIAISRTAVIKSAAFKDNYVSSAIDAETYLFAAQVLQQDSTGIEGSVRWGHAGPDWAMDPIVVNNPDPEVRPETDDLLRIPTVSVSVDPLAMFGKGGIYIAGENIEKPISFEFFDPSRSDTGVQTNSTIQIVGGSSPQRWKSDKLSMRVRFTEDEGASELEYPVFGAGVTSVFDTLVLDARLNNVWHYGGGSSPQNQRDIAQYMRDEFAADLQNEVGGTATHGQHVHVYINGIYWGIHTLHERPDENFVATYLGGEPEDYDVIKHDVNTIVSGSNQPYKDMIAMLGRTGDLSDADYQAVSQQLDVDDFIRYMLVNYYGGNQDWDQHNWYASRSRVEGLWRFHSWDAEKVLQGVNDNATTFNNANAPTFINRRLMTNAEYRQRFADLVQETFYHDGPMTPEATANLYLARSNQIDLVMRVESARWGDNQIDSGLKKRYTRPDWVATRAGLLQNYFPRRTDIVLNQFKARGWITLGQDVEFHVNGTPQYGGHVPAGGAVTLTAAEGAIYYTKDGSDPRLPGGALSPTALAYAGGASLPIQGSVKLQARLQLADGTWGPLSSAEFTNAVPANATNLHVSEVHFHPAKANATESAAGFGKDDFEFVELVNVSSATIDLTQVRFEQTVDGATLEGIAFDFAGGAIRELAAGERLVVVEDANAFALRYPGSVNFVAGEWIGGLANSSERIRLMAGDQVLADFTYSDQWVPDADGAGPSLQVLDENVAPTVLGTAGAWRASAAIGGSPGRSEGNSPGDSNHDGIFNSADFVVVFQAGKYEDGIEKNATFEEGDWDGDGDFTSADIVFAFQNSTYVAAATPDNEEYSNDILGDNVDVLDQVFAQAGRRKSRGAILA